MKADLKMRLKRHDADRWGESQRTFLAVNTLLHRISSSKNFQGACGQQKSVVKKACVLSFHKSVWMLA